MSAQKKYDVMVEVRQKGAVGPWTQQAFRVAGSTTEEARGWAVVKAHAEGYETRLATTVTELQP
jgi:hypothetical protein